MRLILALPLAVALTGAALAAAPDTETCQGCHGAGVSQTEGIPSLGGQQPLYISNQLFMFREGQRKADPMNGIAEPFSDEDLPAYAEAISKLPAPAYAGPAADPARMAAADAAIAKHRCNSCHGATLEGQKGIPRIRSQREEYLLGALTGYKSSDRAGFDPQMNEVAGELSAQEIKDLAYGIAHR